MNVGHARKTAVFSTLVLSLFATAEPTEEAPSPKAAAVAAVPAVAPRPPLKNPEGDVEIAPDSPRASIRAFLELVSNGKTTEAAHYLQVPVPLSDDRGAELSRELAAVLESQPGFSIDTVSPSSDGDADDGLPPFRDRVASVKVGHGVTEPVRMAKTVAGGEWLFTQRTTGRIAGWYDALPSAWAQKNLPGWLAKRGPAGVHFWQWLALLTLIVLAWGIGYVFSRVVNKVATKWVQKTKAHWDDQLVEMAQGPMTLASSLTVAAIALAWLDLPEPVDSFAFRAIKGGFLVVFFWVCVKVVDVVRELLGRAKFANDRPASRSLLSLGARFTKAALFVVLVIACLSLLGLPVASLLAGLGIGGLAVALAGQKTLENLIGTFAIGIDHPFREGDFVKVRDFMGTVESIGLRSTRFRTGDRTLITVPNGKLADEQIETFAARDRLRFGASLAVRYGSKPEELRAAMARLENDLKTKWEKIDTSTVSVKLTELKEWSMKVELGAMVNTVDGGELAQLQQEILLHVIAVFDETGVKLQPIQLVNAPAKGTNGTPRVPTNA
jgi:MscS family membrane protein